MISEQRYKVKFILQLAMKAQSGSTDIALLFLQHRHHIGVGGQSHAPATFPTGKRADLHCTGGMYRKKVLENIEILTYLSSLTQ
jgi:hypothetical protein